jgi:signal transduction histidine kinase
MPDPEHNGGVAVTPDEVVRVLLRAPFTRRTLREMRYALAGGLTAWMGCLLVASLLGAGVLLTVSLIGTFIGLLVLVATLRVARRLGTLYRWMGRRLIGVQTTAPLPFLPGRGVLGRVDARLRDGTAWRAVGYVVLKLPVSWLQAYALSFWVIGAIDAITPLWWLLFRNHPPHTHLGPVSVVTPFFTSFGVATWPGTLGALLVGAASLLAAPWLLRVVTAGDVWLMRGLLGPAPLDQRVRELQDSRAHAVDEAAATLRQVERDLHDGAQVRLAALAMGLGMAKEKLGDEGQPVDPAQVANVRDLVDAAHHSAKEALVELRDLARGIHPPVLDAGLADALATLAARSLVPVRLTTDIRERPTPAIEAIAYFCVAELLANVTKHSGANKAEISVIQRRAALRLRVSDDGAGGADPTRGSGLPGLVQRVRTVDGTLALNSPPGGPTVVTIDLPLRA